MSKDRSQRLAARLELSSRLMVPGDKLEYTVVNTGDLPIMLGGAYALDRDADGDWEAVNLRGGFRAWGRRLLAGDRCKLMAGLPDDLPAGRYRLRKRLRADAEPSPGFEWVAAADIQPIEPSAEFAVTARQD